MPARFTTSQRERFLAGRHVAVLVTLGPDGAPVSTPIWYLWRDGAFWFRTANTAVKTYNARRDPRVSVCVQEERAPYKSLVATGTAEVVPSPPWLGQEIPRHYLGMVGAMGYRRAAQSAIEQGEDVAIVVRPDRFTTSDFTAETPFVGRIWLLARRVLPPWL